MVPSCDNAINVGTTRLGGKTARASNRPGSQVDEADAEYPVKERTPFVFSLTSHSIDARSIVPWAVITMRVFRGSFFHETGSRSRFSSRKFSAPFATE